MGRKEEGGHTHSRVKREALLPSYFFSTRRFFTLRRPPLPSLWAAPKLCAEWKTLTKKNSEKNCWIRWKGPCTESLPPLVSLCPVTRDWCCKLTKLPKITISLSTSTISRSLELFLREKEKKTPRLRLGWAASISPIPSTFFSSIWDGRRSGKSLAAKKKNTEIFLFLFSHNGEREDSVHGLFFPSIFFLTFPFSSISLPSIRSPTNHHRSRPLCLLLRFEKAAERNVPPFLSFFPGLLRKKEPRSFFLLLISIHQRASHRLFFEAQRIEIIPWEGVREGRGKRRFDPTSVRACLNVRLTRLSPTSYWPNYFQTNKPPKKDTEKSSSKNIIYFKLILLFFPDNKTFRFINLNNF